MIVFLVAIIVFGFLMMVAVGLVTKKKPYVLHKDYFHNKWMDLLARVKSPEGMILAVIDADKLLDEALRKRHFRGKTTGERLVAAQRLLTDNDGVWYAHKLRNRLVHEQNQRLGKKEAVNALEGFKKALHDLGAL